VCRVFIFFPGGTRAQISIPLQPGPAGAQVAHRTLQEAGLPDAEVGIPVRSLIVTLDYMNMII